jgi:hypothetical protein
MPQGQAHTVIFSIRKPPLDHQYQDTRQMNHVHEDTEQTKLKSSFPTIIQPIKSAYTNLSTAYHGDTITETMKTRTQGK